MAAAASSCDQGLDSKREKNEKNNMHEFISFPHLWKWRKININHEAAAAWWFPVTLELQQHQNSWMYENFLTKKIVVVSSDFFLPPPPPLKKCQTLFSAIKIRGLTINIAPESKVYTSRAAGWGTPMWFVQDQIGLIFILHEEIPRSMGDNAHKSLL